MKNNKIQEQIQELQKQNELMRKLATPNGFYEYYFSQLPKHRTQESCFNAVNEMYFYFFGEYLYSSYTSFANSKLYRRKK